MKPNYPTLRHLADFDRVLANYQPNNDSLQALRDSKVVFLTGPSGSGREVIINELLKTGKYYNIVSDTSRLPRVNNGVLEKNGIDYWFKTEEEILDGLKAGNYLEAAIIHRHVSGISADEIIKAARDNKIVIKHIEITGTETLHKYKPNISLIFLVPPGFEEWQRRLNRRGEMSKEEHRIRMFSALNEITTALKHDYYNFVINDNLIDCVFRCHKLAMGGAHDAEYDQRARAVAKQLAIDVQHFLDA